MHFSVLNWTLWVQQLILLINFVMLIYSYFHLAGNHVNQISD